MVRDRYSSVKRGLTDGNHSPNKMRNVGLPAVVGTRTQEKIREIKSPLQLIYSFLELIRELQNMILLMT